MIYLLVIVAIVEFVYIVYQDLLNRKERDRLQMKLMSKDLSEYQAVAEKPKDTPEPEPSPYISIDDVDVKKLLTANDNL